MDLNGIGKFLIMIGVIIIILGIFFIIGNKINIGKLPGDIIFKKGNFTFYFPLVTCIIISLILTLIFSIINRL